MRARKSERKKNIRHPQVRSLKIQPRFRESIFASKPVPEIRLCGEWLKKLGFVQGRKVIITTMNELLIVRLESKTGKPFNLPRNPIQSSNPRYKLPNEIS